MGNHLLEVKGVDVLYGDVQAVWDVSIKVKKGTIVALVGANGAGKTTLLKTISGIIPAKNGEIFFSGKSLTKLKPQEVVDRGISHVPEGGRVFPDMSVYENLEMGAYAMSAWEQRDETLQQIYKIFPILQDRAGQLARTLSGGERQMLAIGRGLMSKPKLCLLDEPSYGLAPKMVKEIFRVVNQLRDEGITVLLIEQNVRPTLEAADRAYVLENGRISLEGTGKKLLKSSYIRKAYLGL